MRSERTATCTSGDPVSPALVAYVLITSALRSGVIDIGYPFLLTVFFCGRAGMSSSGVAARYSGRATRNIGRAARGSSAYDSRNPGYESDTMPVPLALKTRRGR